MDNIIRALPKEIADKIAAGEVVERPLSIVKELLENSIDAGSSNIVIEIKKGGKEYIRVTDDGCGIHKDQLALAFMRYATSKIFTEQDLDAIESLGFRGEALASIAAVSRIELVTKTAEEKTGSRISLNGGEVVEITDAACQDGTTIVVTDLFYNIPARKKFLKPDNAESSLITDFVSRMAIAYPNIRFRLINNGTILYSTLGNNSLKQAIMTVFSPDITRKIIPVEAEEGDMRISGYISSPSECRNNRRYQIFFVNGRLVKSFAIERSLDEAYRDKVFEGKYPAAFLFIELDPSKLDVNIHPSKTEIRFYEEEELRAFVVKSIRRALLDPQVSNVIAKNAPKTDAAAASVITSPVSSTGAATSPVSAQAARSSDLKSEAAPSFTFAKVVNNKIITSNTTDSKSSAPIFSYDQLKDAPHLEVREDTKESSFFAQLRDKKEEEQQALSVQQDLIPEKASSKLLFSSLELIGSVFDTYLIAKDAEYLYLIDQHAAHERVLFEKLMARFNSRDAESQMLLIPTVLRLSPAQKLSAMEMLPVLKELGYEIEDFGVSELIIKAVPSCMGMGEAESFLNDFLEDPKMDPQKFQLKRDEIISNSCKAAIKGGDRISATEGEELLRLLDGCENPYNCPHGRPTYIRYSRYELERLFLRK